jgi:hypothetical protein
VFFLKWEFLLLAFTILAVVAFVGAFRIRHKKQYAENRRLNFEYTRQQLEDVVQAVEDGRADTLPYSLEDRYGRECSTDSFVRSVNDALRHRYEAASETATKISRRKWAAKEYQRKFPVIREQLTALPSTSGEMRIQAITELLGVWEFNYDENLQAAEDEFGTSRSSLLEQLQETVFDYYNELCARLDRPSNELLQQIRDLADRTLQVTRHIYPRDNDLCRLGVMPLELPDRWNGLVALNADNPFYVGWYLNHPDPASAGFTVQSLTQLGAQALRDEDAALAAVVMAYCLNAKELARQVPDGLQTGMALLVATSRKIAASQIAEPSGGVED